MLAEITLPIVIKGLFYIGMLAAIMSSLSSLTLISAITVGRDIVGRWKQADIHSPIVKRWTEIGLIFSALVSIALAVAVPSVVGLWYTIGTCIIPGLLIPVVSSYFERLRIPASYALGAMLNGWFVSTASLLTRHSFIRENSVRFTGSASNRCIRVFLWHYCGGYGGGGLSTVKNNLIQQAPPDACLVCV